MGRLITKPERNAEFLKIEEKRTGEGGETKTK